MKKILATLSLLAMSGSVVFNTFNQTNIINHNKLSVIQNHKIQINKIKLPTINQAAINVDSSYQIANNIFITLKKDFKTNQITCYYLNVTNPKTIIIKNLGIIPKITDGFYYQTTQLTNNTFILYRQLDSKYIYIDLSNLDKPLIVTNTGPSQAGHNPLIKKIIKINNTKLMILTIDGICYTDTTDISHPTYFWWDTKDIQFLDLLKITDDSYLVNGIISTEVGIKPQLCLLNTSNLDQPTIKKLQLKLPAITDVKILAALTNEVFMLDINKTLYALKIANLIQPQLINLNVSAKDNTLNVQILDSQQFIISATDVTTNIPQLLYFNVSNWQKIVKKSIILPKLTNINDIFNVVYLNNNNLVIRIISNGNKIVTYILNITNIDEPNWTDVGVGIDNILWKPVKLSATSVLLNDANNNCWYAYL